jgi:hypothetical protein
VIRGGAELVRDVVKDAPNLMGAHARLATRSGASDYPQELARLIQPGQFHSVLFSPDGRFITGANFVVCFGGSVPESGITPLTGFESTAGQWPSGHQHVLLPKSQLGNTRPSFNRKRLPCRPAFDLGVAQKTSTRRPFERSQLRVRGLEGNTL